MAEQTVRAPHAYTISLDGIPPGPNLHLHPLVRFRRAKRFGDEVAWQARKLVSDNGFHAPFARAHVMCTITQRSRRYTMDRDNLFATCKPLVDALIGRLIRDDSPAHITLEVQQEVVPDAARGVRLEVTEVLKQEQEVSADG